MTFWRSLAGAGAALTLAVSLAACSSTTTADEPAAVEDAQVEAGTTESSQPEAVEAEAAEPTWTAVTTITGNADQQSDTIALTGGKVRVTYDFVDSSGSGMVLGAIYVLDEGTDLMKDGGIPDVTVSEAGAGETILRKGEGEYYVKVAAANVDYTVTIEEEK